VSIGEDLEVLGYDVASWLAAYRDDSYPLEHLGSVTFEVTRKLRMVAIIMLLAHGDVDAWCHNLVRSARCRQIYLRRLRDGGIADDHHQASGRIDPFLDAVAAAQFSWARGIAAVSLTGWLRGHEYEDDYCYAQVLHGLIAPVTDVAAALAMLDRMAAVNDGRTEPRAAVARALVNREQQAFAEAFEALLEERTKQIDADRQRQQIEDRLVISQRLVYVEGLALLQIADRLGLRTQRDYQYCPALAREPMRRPFPGE